MLNLYYNNVVTKLVVLVVVIILLIVAAILFAVLSRKKPASAAAAAAAAPAGSVSEDRAKLVAAINKHNASRGGLEIKVGDIKSVSKEGTGFLVAASVGGSTVTYRVDAEYKTVSVAV
jgi:hypothetical protein